MTKMLQNSFERNVIRIFRRFVGITGVRTLYIPYTIFQAIAA